MHCVDLVKSFQTNINNLLAKIGVDTAKNEPSKVWRIPRRTTIGTLCPASRGRGRRGPEAGGGSRRTRTRATRRRPPDPDGQFKRTTFESRFSEHLHVSRFSDFLGIWWSCHQYYQNPLNYDRGSGAKEWIWERYMHKHFKPKRANRWNAEMKKTRRKKQM